MRTAWLTINQEIQIPKKEIRLSFSRSAGPGGQNVNKVNTRVQLRFDLLGSPSLTDSQKEFLQQALASKLTNEGVLILFCGTSRSQRKNIEECVARFQKMLFVVFHPPKERIPTKPSEDVIKKRIAEKRYNGEKKRSRQCILLDELYFF